MYALLFAFFTILACTPAQASPELAVRGRNFVDPQGRAVILRGVNISASAKAPPFIAIDQSNFSQLDPLKDWGMNVMRLIFIWEAFEPAQGVYDESYLDKVAALADAAFARGIFTVIDMHQDSFSRFVGDGCGVGFPAWVSGHDASKLPGKPCGTMWAVNAALSDSMHHAYDGFYKNEHDGRTHFIEMWAHIAQRMKAHPGVIGYDLINEPWADEDQELTPLYEDTAWAIHREDPSAIIFLEPYLLAVTGLERTNLARPKFDHFVYAPHYYDAIAVSTMHYYTNNPFTDFVFQRMPRKAREWNAPLFVGEFGAFAETTNVEQYMDHQYELLDENLASAAQWNYTPAWTREKKDGWNAEDYSIVDNLGHTRRNFKARPYPRRVAGLPLKFKAAYDRKRKAQTILFKWQNEPKSGTTEIFIPRTFLANAAPAPALLLNGAGLSCAYATGTQLLTCTAPNAGPMSVLVAPVRSPNL